MSERCFNLMKERCSTSSVRKSVLFLVAAMSCITEEMFCPYTFMDRWL